MFTRENDNINMINVTFLFFYALVGCYNFDLVFMYL
jgi:hypothetical protein